MQYPTPEELDALRSQLDERLSGHSVVVVGVGNSLRGDDAVGVLIAERIEGQVAATVFHAYDVPENYAVKAANLRPGVVLLVDAADMRLPAGSVRLLVAEDLPPVPGASHRPSLEMFAAFVRLECGAESYVLGVQPDMEHVDLGADMSAGVLRALDAVEGVLLDVLSDDAVA